MTRQEELLVERLCKVESPRKLNDWENQDGYYVAACRVSAEDVPGLIDIVRKWNDLDWPSDADIDQDEAELLPVTAWRALADLKADAAVEPLVDMLREWDDELDDWLSEELPHVFGKIGESAIDALTCLATKASAEQFVRSIAARGLRYVADYHAHTRDRIVVCLTEMMTGAADGEVEFNTTLLSELVDLQAIEAAEPIERAFAANLVDVGMMGDWEDVRRELGVEGLGLKMPENPYNSGSPEESVGKTCAYLDGPSDLSPRESEQQSLGLVERICLGPASSSFHPSGPCAALGVSPDG